MSKRNSEKEVTESRTLGSDEKERLVGELGIDEGRRSLDHQVETLRQQRDHFIEIMKLNLICLSILVAAFGIGRVSFTGLNPVGVALPLIFFLVSIVLSISTFHTISPTIGMDDRAVLELDANDDLSENVFSIKNTYAEAISQNRSKIMKSSRLMLFSYFSTLVGISSTIAVVSMGVL
ncbi:hypothetical protein [Halorubrum halophilum]|uniref:hypothetical protein n=1 Tax=Halorubrum halophilum TaxID=413816 RepID=UPI00186B17C5|nr:hypothetical protein [Halorubrum halophilum]